MGPNKIHPRVPKELMEELTKALSIICQQSWLSGQVSVDWKAINVTSIYEKGRKEDLGSYRLLSLTSVPEKVTEQITLSANTWHVQEKQGINQTTWV